MGFYYNSGQPPEDPDKPMGWRDTFAIVFGVFRVLAVPVGILFGVIVGVVVLIMLFFTHWTLGMAAILVILGVIGVRAWWEWRHPPTLDSLEHR